MNPMSRLHANRLSSPTDATSLREFGWRGRFEISMFQGLSGGKTWRAVRIRSASGVLNINGRVIGGIGGRLRPAAGPPRGSWPIVAGSPRTRPQNNATPAPQRIALDHRLMARLRNRGYDGPATS